MTASINTFMIHTFNCMDEATLFHLLPYAIQNHSSIRIKLYIFITVIMNMSLGFATWRNIYVYYSHLIFASCLRRDHYPDPSLYSAAKFHIRHFINF